MKSEDISMQEDRKSDKGYKKITHHTGQNYPIS
jgi:hypothetical protein